MKTDNTNAMNPVSEMTIQWLPINALHDFRNHPFQVKDDERMAETVESIRQNGVIEPAIARPVAEDSYELISGHRRKHACELLGMDTMPVIVRNLNDDEADILMVDSNLQRESILPSERSFAYKMKLEAMKHQGQRTDSTSSQLGTKTSIRADLQLAQELGTSRNQIQRYVRLTHLIPELLDMLDNKKLAFNPAVELSYLTSGEQYLLAEALERAQCSPSLSQAQRLKKLSKAGKLSSADMDEILSEDKKQPLDRIMFDKKALAQYFPPSYTSRQMEEVVLRLLAGWRKKRQQEMSR